jgi:hypothetical protein
VQHEAAAVWQKLWSKASFLDGATADTSHEFQRRFILGKFAASIETVQGTADPVEMSASVGWASANAFAEYDFDETFRTAVTTYFVSRHEGGWFDAETGDEWSDDDVVEALLDTLGEWIRTDGRFIDW